MKKLLYLLIFFFLNTQSYTSDPVEKTDIYCAHIKSMPFWTFWNYNKVLVTITQLTQLDKEAIEVCIKFNLPILYTWNPQEAEHLKKEVEALNGEIEIIEIKGWGKFVNITHRFEQLVAENNITDLNEARSLYGKLLEELNQDN